MANLIKKVSILWSLLLLLDCSNLTAAQDSVKGEDVKNAIEIGNQFFNLKAAGYINYIHSIY